MCACGSTTNEDCERCCGQRDDQRRAGKQRVDNATDALANDGLPDILRGQKKNRERKEVVQEVEEGKRQDRRGNSTSKSEPENRCKQDRRWCWVLRLALSMRGLPISPCVLSSLSDPKAMAGSRMAM